MNNEINLKLGYYKSMSQKKPNVFFINWIVLVNSFDSVSQSNIPKIR